jgi:hypothetical protein
MALDLKIIKSSIGRNNLLDESFYVWEQIPGRHIYQDFTKHLNKVKKKVFLELRNKVLLKGKLLGLIQYSLFLFL